MPVLQRQFNFALFEKIAQSGLVQDNYRHAKPGLN
ncbi:hypothetical protein MHK_010570 [Candidatus Magnetomorum sp. HK-1]|nr:hypothetical protein MHK_010570 [Candidatus Magnetomorum sp. HK-1]